MKRIITRIAIGLLLINTNILFAAEEQPSSSPALSTSSSAPFSSRSESFIRDDSFFEPTGIIDIQGTGRLFVSHGITFDRLACAVACGFGERKTDSLKEEAESFFYETVAFFEQERRPNQGLSSCEEPFFEPTLTVLSVALDENRLCVRAVCSNGDVTRTCKQYQTVDPSHLLHILVASGKSTQFHSFTEKDDVTQPAQRLAQLLHADNTERVAGLFVDVGAWRERGLKSLSPDSSLESPDVPHRNDSRSGCSGLSKCVTL